MDTGRRLLIQKQEQTPDSSREPGAVLVRTRRPFHPFSGSCYFRIGG